MTSRRARAYARVTMTLDNLGPAALRGPEQARIRHLAHPLLFCADHPNHASARAEFADVEALLEYLVACGRWRPERAGSLGDAAYATYRAALEREAQAARMLELRLAAA
jgi:hypothetical protein